MNNNRSFNEKVTILIVTFKSYEIIEKCLNNIDKKFNIILIENSNDLDFTSKLEKKYQNLKSINIGYDSGYGYALNRGIEKTKTDYIISINPDSFPEADCFEKLILTADKNEDAVLITPVTYLKNNKQFSAYGFFDKKKRNLRFLKFKINIFFFKWICFKKFSL